MEALSKGSAGPVKGLLSFIYILAMVHTSLRAHKHHATPLAAAPLSSSSYASRCASAFNSPSRSSSTATSCRKASALRWYGT